MTTITKIYVGIDISKKYLDIHIYTLKKDLQILNSQQGIQALLNELSGYQVGQIAIEASGGYEYPVHQALKCANYNVWLVDPKRVRAFIISEGIRAKTDKIDARMLALFAAQKQQNYQSILPSAAEEKMRSFGKRRTDLLQIINMEENRLGNPQQQHCRKSIRDHITFMKKQVKEIDKEIDLIIESDSDLSNKVSIIESIPGVGRVTAATLISSLPELGNIEDKKIAALVGVAPIIQQSGISKGTAIIRGGRPHIRNIVYMAALVGIRFNPLFKEIYNKMVKVGKKPKVALVAIMRRLMVILNNMVRKGQAWNYAT